MEPEVLDQISDSVAIIGMRNFIAHGYDRHRSAEFIELLKEIDAYYPPEVTIHIILDNHSAHMSSANSGNWFSQFLPKDLTGSSELAPFSYHFTV